MQDNISKELKTLKDLEIYDKDEETYLGLIDKDELKQEAIKWVKELKEMPDEIDFEIFKEKQRMNDGARLWIKHFFNLTEEDLK